MNELSEEVPVVQVVKLIWSLFDELQNLSNRDFLAQFVKKLCKYEHNSYFLKYSEQFFFCR